MEDNIECCICLQKLENNIEKLNCSHLFHIKCINKWRKKNSNCPICRKNIISISNYSKNSKTFVLSLIILIISSFMIIIFKLYINNIYFWNEYFFNTRKILENIFIKIKNTLDFVFKEVIKKKNVDNIKIKDIFNNILNPHHYILNFLKEMINGPIEIIIKELNEKTQLNTTFISMNLIEKLKEKFYFLSLKNLNK